MFHLNNQTFTIVTAFMTIDFPSVDKIDTVQYFSFQIVLLTGGLVYILISSHVAPFKHHHTTTDN